MNKIEKSIPESSPIKPEYIDLPWDEFVSMDSVLSPSFAGILMMNKNLDVLDTRNGKITRVYEHRIDNYGYQFYDAAVGDISISFKIHRKGSYLFLVNDNPEKKIFVDHCNRNPSDCRLSNFRHATPKENAENSTPRKENDRNFLRKKTLGGSFVGDIPYTKLSIQERNNIFTCMKRWGKYKNHIYEKHDIIVDEYIEKYGPPVDRDWDTVHPELGGWIKHWEFPGLWINSNGFMKKDIGRNKGELTVGNYDQDGYLHTNIADRKNKVVSRIIIGGFLHIPYDELNKVDHIDTLRDHNSLNNLRNGTQKENMNNPLTCLHLSDSVSRIDMHTFEIKSYSSQIEAEKENGLYICGGLKICCDGDIMTMGGYIWAWKGEEEERIEKFLRDIEDPNKNMPPGYWNLDTLKYWANKLGCTKIIHFHDKCEGGYEFARSNNLLDKIFPSKLQKYPRGWWDNLDHVLEVAKECKNKQELMKKYPGANRAVNVHGWKDKLIFKKS